MAEKFAWLSVKESSFASTSAVLVGNEGFCSMEAEEGSCATVAEIDSGKVPGLLMSAAAVVAFHMPIGVRYLLIKRYPGADGKPGKYQFPAGRSEPEELPLTTACRELQEEVFVQYDGRVGWGSLAIRVGGQDIDYLFGDCLHGFRGRFVQVRNTLEFYYPMDLVVQDAESIVLRDNEGYGRELRLVSREELVELADAGLMTDAAAAITAAVLPLMPA